MYPEKPTCHEISPVFKIANEITWEERNCSGIRHCSYCGSVHPEDLLKLFEKGAYLEGSDWKYGYPHKYYIKNTGIQTAMKFYTDHMKDLFGQPEFETVAKAIREKFTGKYYPTVTIVQDDGKLVYITGGRDYESAVNWHKIQVAIREKLEE